MKFGQILKKKANVKMIRNVALFLGLILLTFWFIFKDQDFNELVNVIKSVNINYVMLGIVIMFG